MNLLNNLRKPYFALFLSSLMLFASCSQYSDEVNSTIDPVPVSKSQITEIGNIHNDYMSILSNRIETRKSKNAAFSKMNTVDQLREEFNTIVEEEVTDENIKTTLYETIDDEDFGTMAFVEKHIDEELAIDYLNQVMNVINSSVDIEASKSELDIINENASNNENLINKNLIAITVEVGKKSLELWTSQNRGGNGVGKSFFTKNSLSQKSASDIGDADAAGAAGGSLTLAVVGSAVALSGGTLAPVAVLGIGLGALWASAFAAAR